MIPILEVVNRITGLRDYGRPVSGYTYPCYRYLAHRLLSLTVGQRSSLVPRVDLQESLGLVQTGREEGEMADEQLDRLVRCSRESLASSPGAQANLDLRRFLTFLGRLLFATRGDVVHCQFLPLLEDLDQVWTYLHLPSLGRGILERPSLVPLARRWVPCRDTHPLEEQLASIQEAIDVYPQLDVDTRDLSQGIVLPVWDSVSTHLMGRSTHSGISVT
ncbi:hypothetical protein Taro_017649 [Colocasia esculenta]|uniref:Uncharacterized protein n=1 Tax=Colocasia esculenta TaxID=4460 RepID=A0A843UP77_COLES|nr:hypothetical protein [Colocasia esculenta]